MKSSKVIPVFKSGDVKDPTNYRPISVLPVLSKVFEKIILNQLLPHFKGLLHDKQYGFTKGCCTVDAGAELMRTIFKAWEESHDAVGVFCDLSKAFDCVDHKTLLNKLCHYGIKGKALDLMGSYLNDRTLQVYVNGAKSIGSSLEIGVPQGSILGPFLFLVYINDLPHMLQKLSKPVLFADDTSLIFKVSRCKPNIDEVNNTLVQVVDWFAANNLVLNPNKTKCIRFTLPNVRRLEMNVSLKGNQLQFVEQTTFLGLIIDSRLQWGPHICALSDRLSSAAFAVRRIRQLTDVATARLVYFSYFHSIMSYGILLWGRAADIESVFILQKRAIRAIYGLQCRDSLRELFKKIEILTMPCQYIYENIMYIRKNREAFNTNESRHTMNTRNKSKLATPLLRLAKTSKSFIGNCIRIYNKIPQNIVTLPGKKFKTVIKTTLFKKAYYKLDDYLNDKNAWL